LDHHLTEIMTAKSKDVESMYEDGMFVRVFWDAQKRALSVKKLSAMRWNPVIIRWCLYLRHLAGSSAYEMLREAVQSDCHHRGHSVITHTPNLDLVMMLTSS